MYEVARQMVAEKDTGPDWSAAEHLAYAQTVKSPRTMSWSQQNTPGATLHGIAGDRERWAQRRFAGAKGKASGTLRDESGEFVHVAGFEEGQAELFGDEVAERLGVGESDHLLVIAITVGHPPELAETLILPDPQVGLEGKGTFHKNFSSWSVGGHTRNWDLPL